MQQQAKPVVVLEDVGSMLRFKEMTQFLVPHIPKGLVAKKSLPKQRYYSEKNSIYRKACHNEIN